MLLEALKYIIFPVGVHSDRDNGNPTQFQECMTLANPDGMNSFQVFINYL